MSSDSLEQERRQCHVLFAGDFLVNTPEPFRVVFAIIRRKSHTDYQYPRISGLCFRNHSGDVMFHLFKRKSTQTVIASEFDDNDRRLVCGKELGQPGKTIRRGVATDTGVGNLVIELFQFEPLCQQRDPTGLHIHAVSRAQTVANHEQRTRSGR